jgi:hypothetical protein
MHLNNYNPPLSPLVRIFFAVVALILMVGMGLFFAPELVARRWPWALTPFNTRFLGALYLAELVIILTPICVNRLAPNRLVLPMALIFTLLVTIVSLFYPDQFDFRRRAVWAWFIVYGGSAVISAGLFWWYRAWPVPAIATPTPKQRQLFLQLEGVALGLYGLGLLLAPAIFSAFWPWKVDNFHAQIYSAIFISGAVSSFILARAAAPIEFLAIGSAQIVLGALAIAGVVIVDVSLHKINWMLPSTWLWLVMFAIMLLIGLSKLWWSLDHKSQANAYQSVSSYAG